MNYFELFNIPVQLKVNTALLSKKFFELSKKYHPDYFANDNEEVQAEALVRDLGGYARMLDFVAAASGTIVNVNALCRAVTAAAGPSA